MKKNIKDVKIRYSLQEIYNYILVCDEYNKKNQLEKPYYGTILNEIEYIMAYHNSINLLKQEGTDPKIIKKYIKDLEKEKGIEYIDGEYLNDIDVEEDKKMGNENMYFGELCLILID